MDKRLFNMAKDYDNNKSSIHKHNIDEPPNVNNSFTIFEFSSLHNHKNVGNNHKLQ
jgi:hypothetical protein